MAAKKTAKKTTTKAKATKTKAKAKTSKTKTKAKTTKSKSKAKTTKPKNKKRNDESFDDMSIVVVEDDIEIDQEKINEERRAYLEEARSQEASD